MTTDHEPPLIELKDLGVCFRLRRHRPTFKRALLSFGRRLRGPQFWALRHIDLEFHRGDVVGIVGLNGAGKSTLCMTICNILLPDEGEAVVRGEVSTVLSLGAGMHQDLTGRENVRLYAAFLGMSRAYIEPRLDDIVAFAELEDFIDEPLRHYSAGMRSRLAFSVATSIQPEILVLDELINMGDASFRGRCKSRIAEMMSRSKLIILVSHSTGFLRETCTRGVWLENGGVRTQGDIDEVIDAYNAAPGRRGSTTAR